MQHNENPFKVTGYHGPELFCGRENETRRLTENLKNGINTVLLSVRRMGKTGLIHHVFHRLKASKRASCVYLDIHACQGLKDFTDILGSAILETFPEKKTIGREFMKLLKSLRPVISYEALTGQPQVSFDSRTPGQQERSLGGLFGFLENQRTPVAIAIDEFQQVALFGEKNTEALLPGNIQRLRNVHFIFSGSSKHLLAEIFSSSKRPFFASTQTLSLGTISEEEYAGFIRRLMHSRGRKISGDAVQFILEWSRLHTYYTQSVCNRVFASGEPNITLQHVQAECSNLLKEHEYVFFQYRSLLTPIQWALLGAIAKEDKVYQPSSKKFLQSHHVGTPANIQRALEALLNKEMIYREQEEDRNYYRVYDGFLARWLENY